MVLTRVEGGSMRWIAKGLLLTAIVSTPVRAQSFTTADRARIESEVRKVVDSVFSAARALNFEKIQATLSKQEGVCLFPDTIEDCSKIAAAFRQEWSSKASDRFVRQ